MKNKETLIKFDIKGYNKSVKIEHLEKRCKKLNRTIHVQNDL